MCIRDRDIIAEDIEKVIDMPVSLLTPAIAMKIDININDFSLNALGAAMIALHKSNSRSTHEAA